MKLSPPSQGVASLVLFAAASLWGLYWIPLRAIEEQGVFGGWAVVILNLPAAIVLGAIVLLQGARGRAHFRTAFLIGAVAGTALSLYSAGLIFSSVVRATLLFYLIPVWGTLIGVFWLGERATWLRWAAIAVGLAGMVLLLSGGGTEPLNIGDGFALVSGMLWACTAAMIVRYESVPVASMVTVQFLFTSLGGALIGLFAIGGGLPSGEAVRAVLPDAATLSVIVFIPAVCTIFWAQKYVFPGRAGLLMMSEVIFAVLSASILLPEEQMSIVEWTGAALIIGACLVEVLVNSAAPKAAAQT